MRKQFSFLFTRRVGDVKHLETIEASAIAFTKEEAEYRLTKAVTTDLRKVIRLVGKPQFLGESEMPMPVLGYGQEMKKKYKPKKQDEE